MKWIVIGWFDDTMCQVYAHAPSLKEAKKLRLDAIELENYQIRQYTKVTIVCDPKEFLEKKLAFFGENHSYYNGAKWVKLWIEELEEGK